MSDPSIDSQVVDAVTCLVIAIDPAGRFVRFNRACEQATGYMAAEILGHHFADVLIPPVNASRIRDDMSALLTGTFPCKYECDVLNRDGRRNRIAWSFSASGEGKCADRIFIAMGTQIKTERQASPVLGDNAIWFTKLIETADEGVGIIDPEGRLTYVNPRLSEMIGYSIDEITGRRFFEFMTPEAQDDAREHLKRRQRGLRENYEVKLRRKDGSTLWVQNRTNPLLDEQGRMVASLGMVVDITARKESEQLLRRSEELNRRIIDAVPGGIVLVGLDGSVLRTNAEAERILGLRFDENSQIFVSDFQNLASVGRWD